MNRATDIGWVEPGKPIRGLDHLGVQAPCIALYPLFLSGIINVTDRARYYSFYTFAPLRTTLCFDLLRELYPRALKMCLLRKPNRQKKCR